MTDKALRKRAGQNNIAIAVWRATECAGVALKGSFVRNVLDAQAKVFLQHSHSSSAPALVIGTFCICMRGWSPPGRSEEHTSELQSLMRISYAVFCLKTKNKNQKKKKNNKSQHKYIQTHE